MGQISIFSFSMVELEPIKIIRMNPFVEISDSKRKIAQYLERSHE